MLRTDAYLNEMTEVYSMLKALEEKGMIKF